MDQGLRFETVADARLLGAWAMRAAGPITTRWCRLGPGVAPPDGDEIVLWLGRLPDGSDLHMVAELAGFSETEQARANRFRHEPSRCGFVGAHAALRLVLASMLGVSARSLTFAAGEKGKPRLCNGALEFNLSHKGDIVALAVAQHPVGVDLERVVWREDYAGIALRQFAPEAARLGGREGADRAPLFFRHWTLGEALIKATGQGLSQDTTGFCFNDDGPPRLQQIEAQYGPTENWSFGQFRAGAMTRRSASR